MVDKTHVRKRASPTRTPTNLALRCMAENFKGVPLKMKLGSTCSALHELLQS
jgi:hypothetical protein